MKTNTKARRKGGGGYRTFICADGRQIEACGRKRQAMELLIEHRADGKGLRKGTGPAWNWNLADNLGSLARMGVKIGKRQMKFPDGHTMIGTGGVCDYFLLEAWQPLDDLVDDALPDPDGPCDPFLTSGSIKSAKDIELLAPLKKRKKHGGDE